MAVDLRPDSPTCGRWEGFRLSADQFQLLFIPKGFAHGFCVLSESADLFYKCSDLYAPELQGGFCWDDPAVGITWPVTAPILSDRDRAHPPLVRPG